MAKLVERSKWRLSEFMSVGRVVTKQSAVGCRHVMRVRRAAAPDRHYLSVSLYTNSLCDTFSHVFTIKPSFEIKNAASFSVSFSSS